MCPEKEHDAVASVSLGKSLSDLPPVRVLVNPEHASLCLIVINSSTKDRILEQLEAELIYELSKT